MENRCAHLQLLEALNGTIFLEGSLTMCFKSLKIEYLSQSNLNGGTRHDEIIEDVDYKKGHQSIAP